MAKQLVLRGEPNERQKEFFLATAKHIAYGGARGGGKSWAMRRKFVLLCSRYAGIKCLLLRRTFPELEQNHIIPLLSELNGFATYNTAQRVFVFPNGSRLKLGYCDTEKDVYQYQGQEYEVIGFEEATQFTEFQMRYISTSNRTTRTDFKPRIYYTCNPGGVGHEFIKRLFIDRRYTEYENPDDYVFIPAKVQDNKALMQADPDYINNLRALPEHLRRAYLDGDWDVIEGQFFTEFRRELHVVKPFPIPADWRKFRSIDWGYNDPTCVLWYAIAPDRHLYVYREIYQDQTLATDMAALIRQANGLDVCSYTVASPDMWQKRGVKDVSGGESIAETFMRNHVPLIKADNSRIIGWQRVRENLALAPDGKPYLMIFDNCTNLIRTLPTLAIDPHEKEDVVDGCEDHAGESLRYGVMSRPTPSRVKEDKVAKLLQFDPFRERPVRRASGYFDL